MLYDQAQLTLAYLEAAQVSGDRFFLEVAEDTLHYVMRQMTDGQGGFYSAEDADSVPPERATDAKPHKMEGAFYLWRSEEIERMFGDDASTVKRRFGIETDGNAPHDPQHEFTGKNLLYVARTVDHLAADTGRSTADVRDLLARARLRMFESRIGRPRPHLDDKVLTAWNGLMIAAFARAARVVRGLSAEGGHAPQPYFEAAARAARFIRRSMWREDTGTLLSRYRDGHADIVGYAEDYAFLVFGLIELFETDPDPEWLSWAIALQRRQDALFWDDRDGGWFSTTGRDPTVLLRVKEDYDGAEPTASSVSVWNLLKLSHLIEDQAWNERIERTLRLFAPRLEQIGRAVPMMAAALSTYLAGVQQVVVIVAEGDSEDLETAVVSRYLPFAMTLTLTAKRQVDLSRLVPLLSSMRAVNGRSAVYICRNFTCLPPVTTVAALEGVLK
jgi:uncharacterized protein YyaL (SSP411 family)